MTGKEKKLLKIHKDGNREMLFVCCVIHRKILVFKSTPAVLNKLLKHITALKSNAKCENLFRNFMKIKLQII